MLLAQVIRMSANGFPSTAGDDVDHALVAIQAHVGLHEVAAVSVGDGRWAFRDDNKPPKVFADLGELQAFLESRGIVPRMRFTARLRDVPHGPAGTAAGSGGGGGGSGGAHGVCGAVTGGEGPCSGCAHEASGQQPAGGDPARLPKWQAARPARRASGRLAAARARAPPTAPAPPTFSEPSLFTVCLTESAQPMRMTDAGTWVGKAAAAVCCSYFAAGTCAGAGGAAGGGCCGAGG